MTYFRWLVTYAFLLIATRGEAEELTRLPEFPPRWSVELEQGGILDSFSAHVPKDDGRDRELETLVLSLKEKKKKRRWYALADPSEDRLAIGVGSFRTPKAYRSYPFETIHVGGPVHIGLCQVSTGLDLRTQYRTNFGNRHYWPAVVQLRFEVGRR